MKKSKISVRELAMVVLLVALIGGVAYYMGFYTPLQTELGMLEDQIAQVEMQIDSTSAKILSMNAMRQELDEIFARPEDEITEIAPYDNKEVVLSLLNGILQRSENYSLSFADPSVNEDGTVRRNVSMSFSCPDYDSAKSIIQDLTECQWRCLVSNLSLSSNGNIMEGAVQVSATITFFESLNLA